MKICFLKKVGWDGSVDTATRYGLDGPGIESRWKIDFPHPSRLALGLTQPPVQRVSASFLRGYRGGGMVLTTHPHLAPRLKKEYRYTCSAPSGLHGLL